MSFNVRHLLRSMWRWRSKRKVAEQKGVEHDACLGHGNGLLDMMQCSKVLALPFRKESIGIFFHVRSLRLAQEGCLAPLLKQPPPAELDERLAVVVVQPCLALGHVDKPQEKCPLGVAFIAFWHFLQAQQRRGKEPRADIARFAHRDQADFRDLCE